MRRVGALVGLVLLVAGCAGTLPAGWAEEHALRGYFEQEYREWWRSEWQAYQAGTVSGQPALLESTRLPQVRRTRAPAPAAVRDALEFYYGAVEQEDWGTVYLHRPVWNGERLWVVRVSTDGDDGWLEVYSERGEFLAAARTYIELLAWTQDAASLRARVSAGTYPPALADRHQRTLWRAGN